MAYATVQNLIDRYDRREIGDLVSDNNDRVESLDLATDPVVLAILDDASGEVESALVAGNRYSPTELSSLTGNSAAHLVRITCAVAMSLLCERRPGRLNSEAREALIKRADEHLQRLRKGENVFNLDDQKEAGTPSVGGLTTVEYQQLNLIRDRTRNYFPERRTPNNR